ncbi:MAG: M18 family aminopeptidase [Treponema sp.]|nr:M18 family aminopeptidase [Treponema sp.]
MNRNIISGEEKAFAREFLNFVEKSPTCFHVIKNIKDELLQKGFVELKECEKWQLDSGGKYFVSRNSTSLISFVLPKNPFKAFMITASHSDSPCFKVKENPEMKTASVVKLNVEKYGGMLMQPWFDRPLGLAGRLVYSSKDEGKKLCIKECLVNFDKNIAMIPNLAIHMNRDANDGHKINVQNELMPVISLDNEFNLSTLLSKETGIEEKDILSFDIFLYNREKPSFWGADEEFVAGPKLDDLECVFSTLRGFEEAESEDNVLLHCVFDNEEVGSQSRQGAASTFMRDTLVRINQACGGNEETYLRAVASSFLVSADNAHALHPNYIQTADPVNRPEINAGIVIKFNAAQKYTSDALSAGIFKKVCKRAGVPFQIYTNNSNVPGGSTLGNISTSQVSLPSVDIGLAQWAMHSCYESAGCKDLWYLVKAVKEFYNSEIVLHE